LPESSAAGLSLTAQSGTIAQLKPGRANNTRQHMHKIALSEDAVARVKMRLGKPHPFDSINPRRTALVVIDMQNYFVKQGHQSEVPAAREIVPNINRLAAEVRRRGGRVVWVRNGTADTRDSWSNYHNYLQTPERSERRLQSMDIGADGYEYWHLNDIRPEDGLVTKKRYSAFLQGSSNIEAYLHEHGIDTVLITGTATNVCCESSARDAMMLNFKTIMVSDGLATHTDREHNAALSAFYGQFGDVQTVDEVFESLARGDKARAAA
jgi:ureidoacrylate peracid hydrolase